MSGGRATYADEGQPEPLGVSLTADGVNVAVYSAHARFIEFCLFDAAGEIETARISLRGRTGPVFHAHISGVRPGDRYGLRAHGPFSPAEGHRFDPCKLLVDPYALALDRPFALHPAMLTDGQAGEGSESAPVMPKAIVMAPPDVAPHRPNAPWADAVFYELHVRGFTMTHPDISSSVRGTFAGLAASASIAHLKRLGVSTVELMPSAAWIDERHLGPLGLSNYWGYNPATMLAPDPRLAPGGWAEVRAATDALADAGIECILDVVLNHTGEGDALGPTLSLRGLDNASYYRLYPDDPASYVDDSGTGNTLALDRPAPLRLAMDALRAWRRYGGMAGFRFDLATALGRSAHGFSPDAPLLQAIDQDPELRALKLIAEPWDLGHGGYQLGRFPPAWGEWNDRFRDTVRGFWRGDDVPPGELARRMAGSQDLLGAKRPSRSLNFIVAHDGFTLADLVAFRDKHNLANGEDGRDGADDNRSWNNGVEGPTEDAAVLQARRRDQRALLATLMASRGAPMLSMGAELGHSQGGNNNAYAQDNTVGWLDWASADANLLAFTARLADIRRHHPALRADRFLTGEASEEAVFADVEWRRADGAPMRAGDWDAPDGATLVMALAAPGPSGLDRVVVIAHRSVAPTRVVLPEPRDGLAWELLADSAADGREGELEQAFVEVGPRSLVVLAETRVSAGRRPHAASDEALRRLARGAGIASDWRDLDGRLHAVSPQTQAALLAAMGWPAQSSEQARTALAALAELRDRRALPHAIVRRAGQPIAAPLRFDPGFPAPDTWLVVEPERGAPLRLRASLHAGAAVATRGADGRPGGELLVNLPPLAVGRYRLSREDRPDVGCRLTVAPTSAFLPGPLRDSRRFGVSAQLYSVRRAGDQGIGDFTSLGDLAAAITRDGAATLAINPLHALFPGQRERASPYFPSDRRLLDPIYLDLDRVLGAPVDPERRDALARLSSIDYPSVWALKAGALEAAFAAAPNPPGLDRFVAAGGRALADFSAFQAVAETRPQTPWQDWPADLRDAGGRGVQAFAAAHGNRVRFHQYLQWLCEAQLATAAERALGLHAGLCRDLAIGAAPDGAEAWARSDLMVRKVSIGAPPDQFSAEGQVWGLPPFDPFRLEIDGYAHFADVLARNMRHAGALRIDHVMGLARLFWIPEGAGAADGAYVSYPLGDLLGQVALESHASGCAVIGEDLGTAPEGLRESLQQESILRYCVLPFETDAGRFRPPEAYPQLALTCASTHDLPPLAGWWEGLDIAEREDLSLITPTAAALERARREDDKTSLVKALTAAGLLEKGADALRAQFEDVLVAMHAYVARSPSVLALAQLDDLAASRDAVNLPGTDRERPNWRRRLTATTGEILASPIARAIIAAIRETRPPGPGE